MRSNSLGSYGSRDSSEPIPSSSSNAVWRGFASFSISMWASRATKLPSARRASGLISASVMSQSRISRASRARMGVARLSSDPLTPVWAITRFAWKSEIGSRLEMWPRPTWSGWEAATSSMSIPPMSLNKSIGCLRVPSHTTPA